MIILEIPRIIMRKDVGVAFAGGGIKALSQIAMIEWMDKLHITPYCLSGTSAGAMVSALVSMGLDADEIFNEIKEAVVEIEQRKILKVSGRELLFNRTFKHGLIDNRKMEALITEICERHGFMHIKDVKIPLAITAVDLYTGNLIVFVSHPHLYRNTHRRTKVVSDISLAKAISASMSFPMVFGSVEFEDMALIDGGVRMNAPIPMLRDYGAKKTLALTMRGEIAADEPLDRSVEVISRVYDLLSREAEYRHTSQVDYLLNVPVVVDNIFELEAADSIYEQGKSVIETQDHLLKAFFKQGLWGQMKGWFR